MTTEWAGHGGFVYATLLPDGNIKVGMATKLDRAFQGQTHHAGKLELLAHWLVNDRRRAEKRAHSACHKWHVTRELFKGASQDLIAAITAELGASVEAQRSAASAALKRSKAEALAESRRAKAARDARGALPWDQWTPAEQAAQTKINETCAARKAECEAMEAANAKREQTNSITWAVLVLVVVLICVHGCIANGYPAGGVLVTSVFIGIEALLIWGIKWRI
jgi:hypothetical protein